MSDYEDERDGAVVEAFFKDEAWAHTLARLKERYMNEFYAAKTPEEATLIWQRALMLASVVNEMQVTQQRGDIVKQKKARDKTGTQRPI
jgi:hypothetical protein